MKRCSLAVRTFLAGASLFLAGLGAAPAAQAALQFDGSPASGSPPATLGGFAMVPSPLDTRADGSTVGDAPATATSTFAFDQLEQLLTIPSSWSQSNWAGGDFAGPVYYTGGSTNVTITLPSPSSAIDFYVSPDELYVPLDMQATATAEDGATISSGEIPVTSYGTGALQASGQFFGFYGTSGEKIASITLSLNDASAFVSDFAFGDFALAGSPVAVDDDLSLAAASDVTVDATGPGGAAVTYSAPTASDQSGGTSPTVSCDPASGSTFAIGSTTVTCTATDPDDSNGPVSQGFNVTVVGAAGQLSDLAAAAVGVGPGNSLADTVAEAQSALGGGDTSGACTALDSFVNEVTVQTGKHVPGAVAPGLVNDAQRIEAVLGCGVQGAANRQGHPDRRSG